MENEQGRGLSESFVFAKDFALKILDPIVAQIFRRRTLRRRLEGRQDLSAPIFYLLAVKAFFAQVDAGFDVRRRKGLAYGLEFFAG